MPVFTRCRHSTARSSRGSNVPASRLAGYPGVLDAPAGRGRRWQPLAAQAPGRCYKPTGLRTIGNLRCAPPRSRRCADPDSRCTQLPMSAQCGRGAATTVHHGSRDQFEARDAGCRDRWRVRFSSRWAGSSLACSRATHTPWSGMTSAIWARWVRPTRGSS